MTLELYTEIALTQNLAKHNLKIGDVVTLVDFVAHPQGGELGCILEIFNAVGESIKVVTVPISVTESLYIK